MYEYRLKNEQIYERERARAKLQIKTLKRLLKELENDIETKKGVGFSLPAVENMSQKIGTTCRKIQAVQFDPSYIPDDTDKGLSIEEIVKQTREIESEIKNEYRG